MKQVYIEDIAADISAFEGREVELKGWVYNMRSSGSIKFLLIRDGTGIIQCVATTDDTDEDSFNKIDNLNQESSVIVSGIVREDKRSPVGFELNLKELSTVTNEEGYPITPKSHGVDFLLNNRHLWIRSKTQWAVLRIRAEVIKAAEDFLWDRGFLRFDAPIFTPSACEGTTTLFEVDYFGEPAYLSQSGQLYNEATALAFGRVYCFGPAFRAEKSKTRRHLTEFWQIEPEIAYAGLEDSIELAENMIDYIAGRVVKNRERELKVLERDIDKLAKIKKPFPRLTYEEAVEKIKAMGGEIEEGEDFGAPQETLLSEDFDSPVIIKNFPGEIKAFYMRKSPENEKDTLSFDVLAPEGYGEIVGGGEREFDIQTLEEEIERRGLPEEAFEWYLDLRKFGSVPHAGYGLGIERTVAWLCGIRHVRETIPFPRMLGRVYP